VLKYPALANPSNVAKNVKKIHRLTMNLIIADYFFNIFEKYQMTENDVLSSYNKPDRFEILENNVRLYLKYFDSSDIKRRALLVGTQLNNKDENLVFSFWVPREYCTGNGNLTDVLEIFSNQFGLRIKIGNKEGFFIRYSERLISGKIKNAFDIIKILAPDQIPCECFGFTSENVIGALNKVSVFYAFAINSGKYHFWLYSYPTVKFEIKSGWYEYVKNNFLEYIQPSGLTKIEIQKQKFTEKLEPDSNINMTNIDVPEIYKNRFNYITKQINDLKNNEKIVFKISFDFPKCLFCQSNNLGKEHIIPKWIIPYLEKTIFEPIEYSDFGDETFESIMESPLTLGKKESSHGFTAHDLVCVSCNNTWMSKLENEVKSILINENKLIKCIPNHISQEESKTLSVWLIVKALLLSNKMHSNSHLIPQRIFSNLMNRNIGEGFLVESSSADAAKVDFHLGKGILHKNLIKTKKISIDRAIEMTSNFFTCSIQLNHLLFRISYLEPTLPFDRITVLKETFKLYPFNCETTKHFKIEDDDKFCKNFAEKGLELLLFDEGLILVEKEK